MSVSNDGETGIRVVLDTYAYGGESIGRLPDGRAIFIPYTLVDEHVQAKLVEQKRGYTRGELIRIDKESPSRVEPRCTHFMACGGCHYQHMSYEVQLQAKRVILGDQLRRIGGVHEPDVEAVIPSPKIWNYRNHVKFHLTSKSELGFMRGRSDIVIPIQECHIIDEALNGLKDLMDIEEGTQLNDIGMRVGSAQDLMLIFEGEPGDPPNIGVEVPVSAVHLSGESEIVISGDDHVFMQVFDRELRVSAGSFFQVNTPMAEAMVTHLLNNLPLSAGLDVIEVFSGVGLFSAFIAPEVARLVAIEQSPSACEDFVINLDEQDNVELYEGAAEDVLPHLTMDADVMIVDPPRSGLSRLVRDNILRMSPRILAYVSCDPPTLARDGRRFKEGGYVLRRITPFDLFPQTYHIESISIWEKR